MNRFTLSILAIMAIISIASCKKEIDWNALGENTIDEKTGANSASPAAAEYYVSYKVDGVAVVSNIALAQRDIISVPRTLTFLGTAASGSNPKLKFYAQESIIGFVAGLNVGNHTGTSPSNFIEYTDSSGNLFSTENDADGIYLFISEISYANGGSFKGTFNGSIKTDKGAIAKITEGKFNLKFSN